MFRTRPHVYTHSFTLIVATTPQSKPEEGSGNQKPRFADLLPDLPFEGLFTPSVAATLSQHIFGYERTPPAAKEEAPQDEAS